MASKKAIQDRILPEALAPVRSAPKPKASAPVKDRGAGAFYSPGDYSRRKGDLLGLRDVQKEFGPRVKSTPAPANYVKSRNLARLRALRDKPLSEQFTPAYYVTNPTDVPKQSMTVAQRMDLRNKILASQAAPKKQPAVAPAAPAKSGSSFGQAFAAARKAGQSTFTFGGKSYTTAMKGEARPATKKAAGTTRAATGGGKAQSSFGKAFASARAAGKSTFSFGGKSYTTAMKGGGGKATPASARAGTTTTRARSFGGKSDVAGPRRDSSGRNVSSASGKRK
jgi:hypothetical protein